MLLFFIILMFFILHIQFLLRNVLFETYDSNYFQFNSIYLFNHDIAVTSLLFSIATTISFGLSYTLAYRKSQRSASVPVIVDQDAVRGNLVLMRTIFLCVGVMQVTANIVLAITSDFTYQIMAETLESSGFIFELRIFLLAALAFIALNVRPVIFWKGQDYRHIRLVLMLYAASILVVQARSRVFEFAAILMFAYLMWAGDRVRWRYLGVIAVALLIPNLLVLGRLGIPDDPQVLIDGLFSFEYSISLNNFLGAAIERSYIIQGGLTFLKSLWLLIPSPVRTLMGIDVIKNEAYEALSAIAEIRGGGYSMLAEMYQNFGWFSLLAFAAMGFGIGALNRRASQVGTVSIVAAVAPLIYTGFVIAFRNDFGVFLKFTVQTFIIAYILRMSMRIMTRPAPLAAVPAHDHATIANVAPRP